MQSAKAIVAATMAAATVVACDKNPVEQNGGSRLTLSPDSVVVGVYESSPLVATVRDAKGAIQHVPLRYVSRDPGVATVMPAARSAPWPRARPTSSPRSRTARRCVTPSGFACTPIPAPVRVPTSAGWRPQETGSCSATTSMHH
jgi:hypothetical protein